jgi:hypothetical protein
MALKSARFLDPKADVMFKKIFTNPELIIIIPAHSILWLLDRVCGKYEYLINLPGSQNLCHKRSLLDKKREPHQF